MIQVILLAAICYAALPAEKQKLSDKEEQHSTLSRRSYLQSHLDSTNYCIRNLEQNQQELQHLIAEETKGLQSYYDELPSSVKFWESPFSSDPTFLVSTAQFIDIAQKRIVSLKTRKFANERKQKQLHKQKKLQQKQVEYAAYFGDRSRRHSRQTLPDFPVKENSRKCLADIRANFEAMLPSSTNKYENPQDLSASFDQFVSVEPSECKAKGEAVCVVDAYGLGREGIRMHNKLRFTMCSKNGWGVEQIVDASEIFPKEFVTQVAKESGWKFRVICDAKKNKNWDELHPFGHHGVELKKGTTLNPRELTQGDLNNINNQFDTKDYKPIEREFKAFLEERNEADNLGFHVTNLRNIPSILKYGLRQDKHTAGCAKQSKRRVYVRDSYLVNHFSRDPKHAINYINFKIAAESIPAVVVFSVPSDLISARDPDDPKGFITESSIGPEEIFEVWYPFGHDMQKVASRKQAGEELEWEKKKVQEIKLMIAGLEMGEIEEIDRECIIAEAKRNIPALK